MRRILRFLLVITLGGIGVGLCLAALIPGARTLVGSSTFSGTISLDPLPQRTTIYAANGTRIAELGLEDRSLVDLSEVPQVVIDAIVATEDQTFWQNPGIDVQALFRAFVRNVSSGEVVQGGSTITQQLVKNRVLTPKRDLNRKLREAILAFRLNNQYSKTEILREYLNTVYFGQGSYGIKAAAERFFCSDDPETGAERCKTLQELSLAEAALLAGLINSPEGNNPFEFPDRARRRRSEVLDLMVEEGLVTRAEADVAELAPLPSKRPPLELRPDNYFVEEVQRRLLADERLGETPEQRQQAVLKGGLKVYTTFDARAYFLAQLAVNEIVPDQPPFTAALVALDPTNGEVRAIVGGPGFDQVQFNLATQGARQPGSAYKAVTLAAALEDGYSPNDEVDGSSPCTVENPGSEPWKTKNAGSSRGVISLRAATTGSVNCAYARLIASLGPEKVVDMAHRLGIPESNEIPPYLSITLGTDEATPLEMATVFATFAADGVHHDPVFIRRVEGPDGEVLFESRSEGVQAVDPQVARTVTDILRGVVSGGTGTSASIGRPVAGKTGTTDELTDAWFVGYTPQLVTAVWMGSPTGKVPMNNVGGRSVFGGTYPAQVFRAFMTSELEGEAALDFPRPDPRLWGRPQFIDEKGGRSAVPVTTTTTEPPPEETTTTPPTTAPPTTAPPTTAPPTTAPPPSSTTTTSTTTTSTTTTTTTTTSTTTTSPGP